MSSSSSVNLSRGGHLQGYENNTSENETRNSNRKINVGRVESYFRVLCGALLITIGSHTVWPLSLFGLAMLLTGVSSYCPLHQALNIETKAARENYYLSYLPKYHPDPLFIFYKDGKVAFANQAAKNVFTEIDTIGDLLGGQDQPIDVSPEENEFSNIIIQGNNDRTYSITLKGSKEIDSVIAYIHDVTELVKLDQEIISTQKEIVYTMGEIGETRSKETGQHVRRVAEYSCLLAKYYGLSSDEAEMLKLASPMHDIGKVAVPDAILNKPGKLTHEEFEIMKNHAHIGFDMLNHSERPILKAAAIVAHEHHEKWDGSGYPDNKSGDDIHIYGRITALADVFDALGSDRVYKKAWPLDRIVDLLEEEKGKHFEPKLVELFLDNLDAFVEIRNSYKD